jgi:hypothetical protein
MEQRQDAEWPELVHELPPRGNVTALLLKRASASRPSGEWNDDGFDVFADGAVVGRISQGARRAHWLAVDVDIGLRPSRGRTPTHGYAATRETAIAAFAKSWRRELRGGAARASAPLARDARPPLVEFTSARS